MAGNNRVRNEFKEVVLVRENKGLPRQTLLTLAFQP